MNIWRLTTDLYEQVPYINKSQKSKKEPRGAFWVVFLKTILLLYFSILTERLFS